MITVYGLTDEHGQIRYVGQTGNPRQRFLQHRSSQKTFTVVGMAKLAEMQEWNEDEESKWIAFFGLENLVNRSPGTSTPIDILPDTEISEIPCITCKEIFLPVTVWQRFCRPQCRDRYHNKKKCQILKREGRKP